MMKTEKSSGGSRKDPASQLQNLAIDGQMAAIVDSILLMLLVAIRARKRNSEINLQETLPARIRGLFLGAETLNDLLDRVGYTIKGNKICRKDGSTLVEFR